MYHKNFKLHIVKLRIIFTHALPLTYTVFALPWDAYVAKQLGGVLEKVPKLKWANLDEFFRSSPLMLVNGLTTCQLTDFFFYFCPLILRQQAHISHIDFSTGLAFIQGRSVELHNSYDVGLCLLCGGKKILSFHSNQFL